MKAGIKQELEKLYKGFDFKGAIGRDPVFFPKKYRDRKDVEVSAFIASAFAYGRIECFMPVVDNVLSAMGKSPFSFLMDFDAKKKANAFYGINYRFNRNEDIVCLVHNLSEVLKKYGSIENAFMACHKNAHKDIIPALSGFVDIALSFDTSPVYGKNVRPSGLLQFFPSPEKGSACKRSNLFLRWMIRDRDVDFGLWKGIPKDRLIIPLDVHVGSVSRKIGLTKRIANDLKTAVEITESLRGINPEDPLKYDFPLCHTGMSRRRDKC